MKGESETSKEQTLVRRVAADEIQLTAFSDNVGGIQEESSESDPMFAQDKDLDFPEGGKQAYLVLFGAFMGLFPSFGILNALGAIQTHLAENQLDGVKSSTVAWIFSILLFTNFLVSVFAGTFFDRNGARIPMIAGTVLEVVGLLAAANSYKVWHYILTYGILVGIGNGIVVAPLFGCVAHYFNRRRGFFISIASSGGSIAGVVFPIALRKLFEEVGYAWSIRILALITLVCYLVSIAFLRERLPLQQSEGTKWQQAASYLKAIDIKGLMSYNYLFTVMGCSFAEAAFFVVSTYQITYARAQGCSLSDSYLMLSVNNATGIAGRWLTGYISDKLGRFNIMITTLLAASVIIYVTLLPFGSNVTALYVFAALWGFSTGSISPLLPVCCAQISRTDEFGRRYGTMYFVVGFGSLVCMPIAGAIIGKGSEVALRNYVIYSGLTIFCSGVFYYISKVFSVGPKLSIKF